LLANPHMSRGLLTGLVMLAAFPADGSYISSAEVARALGLHASTAQRYLMTLEAVGLVERNPLTRKLRLAG
jgi:DNA-binding IclR family transcriptional regulator